MASRERLDQAEARRLDDLAAGVEHRAVVDRLLEVVREAGRLRGPAPARRPPRTAAGSRCSCSWTPCVPSNAMPSRTIRSRHAAPPARASGVARPGASRGRSRPRPGRCGRSRARRGRGRCRRRPRCRAPSWPRSPRRAGRRAGRAPCPASTCATCPRRTGRPRTRERAEVAEQREVVVGRLAEPEPRVDDEAVPRDAGVERPVDRPLEVRDDLGDDVPVARLGAVVHQRRSARHATRRRGPCRDRRRRPRCR